MGVPKREKETMIKNALISPLKSLRSSTPSAEQDNRGSISLARQLSSRTGPKLKLLLSLLLVSLLSFSACGADDGALDVDGNNSSTNNKPIGTTPTGTTPVENKIALGGDCNAQADDPNCVDNAYCLGSDDDVCAGTCTAYVARGGDCSSDTARCGREDNCARDSNTCVENGGLDAVCEKGRCAEGLYCHNKTGTTGGDLNCKALIADGAACDPDSSDRCANGTCTLEGICGPKLAIGSDCITPAGNGVECQTQCDSLTTQKCVDFVPIGGDCTGLNCVESAQCDQFGTEKCVAYLGEGEDCSELDCDPATLECDYDDTFTCVKLKVCK